MTYNEYRRRLHRREQRHLHGVGNYRQDESDRTIVEGGKVLGVYSSGTDQIVIAEDGLLVIEGVHSVYLPYGSIVHAAIITPISGKPGDYDSMIIETEGGTFRSIKARGGDVRYRDALALLGFVLSVVGDYRKLSLD